MKKLDMQLASMCVTSIYILVLGVMLMAMDQLLGCTIFMIVGAIEMIRTMLSPVFIEKQKLEHYVKTTLISMLILLPFGIACASIYNITKIEIESNIYYENTILGLIFFLAVSISLSIGIVLILNIGKEFSDLNYRYIMGKKYKAKKNITSTEEEDKVIDEVIHNLTIKNGKYFLISLITFVIGIVLLETNRRLLGNTVLIVGLIAVVYSNIYINPKLAKKEERKRKKLEEKLREHRQYE